MTETALPATFRGAGRFTPQEHIRFEYRIDRKHRLLRRSHMFPNQIHPSKTAASGDFYVCNSIHAHNLRAGLVYLGPGTSHAFPDYPNEHLLLHLSGVAEWRLAGDVHMPDRGSRLFVPAFLPYEVVNTGSVPVWLLSCYTRVSEWLGTSPEETDIAEGRDRPCYLGAPARPSHGERTRITESCVLEASRNRSVIMDLAAGGELKPRHLPVETVWMVLDGHLSWHVDGSDLSQGPEDLLFVPAIAPFSCRAGDEPVRVVRHEVDLTG